MRSLLAAVLAAATLTPALASAQSLGEVRHDERQIRDDHLALHQAYRDGDPRAVHEARRDLAYDNAERRSDWRDFHRTHPDYYRGPAYAAPRAGWRYRPVATGYRFDPEFYGRQYWVDPVHYHLPPAAPFQRWVRYGNDVALVDVRSGRVATVYNGFFY